MAGDEPRDPRLSDLYRAVAEDQPPAHLDAAIRAAARREVGAGPRAGGASRLRAWRVPMALAAVLVLSVSVVTLVQEEDAGRLADPSGAPPGPSQENQQAPLPQRADASSGQEAQARLGAADPQPKRLAQAPAEKGRRAAEPPRVQLPAAKPEAPVARQRAEAVRQDLPQEPAAPPATAAAMEGPVADRAAAREAEPATAEQAVRAPAVAAAPRAAQREVTLAQAYENEPPQKWLEKIAELRREGRTGEADELLRVFRQRFPDHPLPEGLR